MSDVGTSMGDMGDGGDRTERGTPAEEDDKHENVDNISIEISDLLTPYAYAPPWTPLNPGFYSISGGCRNS